MKKILFSLVALVCSMSINAQVMKVMKGDVVVATYTAEQADEVVFEEAQDVTPGLPTTGTAKATIDGSEVDVNWVQLWENGPKFAEYNVGATGATEEGTTMLFADVAKTGADYVWGANWCTPSKDEMDELLMAAQGNSEAKVTCEAVEISGCPHSFFKFIGKGDYAENSVLFPAWYGGWGDLGFGGYWSSTANGDEVWEMDLQYWFGDWRSSWISAGQDIECFVRPILKN